MRHRISLSTLILAALASLSVIFLFAPLLTIAQRLGTFPRGELSLWSWIVRSSLDATDLLLRSLTLAGAVGFLTTLLSVPLVLTVLGSSQRIQRVLGRLLIVPLLLPPFVGTLGLKRILSRFGTVNLVLLDSGIIRTPVDWLGSQGEMGIIIIQALHFVPFMTLFLISGVKQIDAQLLEAARCLDVSQSRVFVQIVCPLILPSYLGAALLVVMGSLTDIGTPLLFDYRNVIAVRIFDALTGDIEDPVGYILAALLGVSGIFLFPLFGSGLRGNLSSSGRAVRPLTYTFQKTSSRILAQAISAILVCLMFLPHGGVLLLALAESWIMTPLPTRFTFSHLIDVFSHPIAYRSLFISLSLALVSSLLILILGFAIAWIRERRPTWLARGVEQASYLALAVPGIVFAFGYLLFFSGSLLDPRRNPLPLLVVAYTVRKLPYMVKSCQAGLRLVPLAYEESALLVGKTWPHIFHAISLPLIRSHLVTGFLICFCSGMLEVSDSLMLAREEHLYPVSKALYTLAARPDGPTLACALAVHVMFIMGSVFLVLSLLFKQCSTPRRSL
jgi:iron(III) transport system permease protein